MDPETVIKNTQDATHEAGEARQGEALQRMLATPKKANLSRRTRQGVPSGSPDRMRSVEQGRRRPSS
jgi:hypothetical protein